MYSDIYVTLSVEESIKVLQEWVETKGNFIRKIGKNIIDKCTIDFGEGKKAVIVVIEYYTWRNSNQMTATVVIDNAEGNTKIHILVKEQGVVLWQQQRRSRKWKGRRSKDIIRGLPCRQRVW